jgi:glycosyltransferase involved in cell wall biosynthesis
MKTLAIVSSYNERCANASYTDALRREFSKYYHVDVLPLKTRLLRGTQTDVRRAGDQSIEELAHQLRRYDYVNIQFEAGLYGNYVTHILPRIVKLIDACPNLIFTMHRADLDRIPRWRQLYRQLRIRRPLQSFLQFWFNRRFDYSWLTFEIVKYLKRASAKHNIWLLCHTKRDAEILRGIHQFDRVIDYPLTFLSAEEQAQYQKPIDRAAFNARYRLPPDAKTIGLFGFINTYKGFDTVIRSLRFLPPNYHVLIFGGQHPLTITANEPVSQFLGELIELTTKKPKWSIEQQLVSSLADRGLPIASRVHFLGALDDEQFLQAMNSCDCTVLPYLEVGQGMSAVAVLALETRARALYSTNLAILEFQRYAPNAFATFDIGNYLELATKIRNYECHYDEGIDRYLATYSLANNIRMQMGLFEGRATEETVKQPESVLPHAA